MDIIRLKESYVKIKEEIELRLFDFKSLWNTSNDYQIFSELCFCLCTPQTKAISADKAMKMLLNNNILYTSDSYEIAKHLKGLVRFHNNKSNYIVKAREFFKSGDDYFIKDKINLNNIQLTRLFFLDHINGLGLKEASHFLRNIGLGDELAILDRHILKNLVLLDVIKEIPKYLNRKIYFDIEQKMLDFSYKIKIPMAHLDFLLWHNETGKIFK